MFARDIREAIIRAGYDPETTPLVLQLNGEPVKAGTLQICMFEGHPAIAVKPAITKPATESAAAALVPAAAVAETAVAESTGRRRRQFSGSAD